MYVLNMHTMAYASTQKNLAPVQVTEWMIQWSLSKLHSLLWILHISGIVEANPFGLFWQYYMLPIGYTFTKVDD